MPLKKISTKVRHLPAHLIKTLRRRWKLSLVLLLLLIAGGWWFYQRQQSMKPDYTTVSPEVKNVEKVVEVSGIIDAKTKARLRFLAGGKLTYLNAEVGQWVERGQRLATIDQSTLQKQLQQDLNVFMQERLDWDQTIDDVYEDVYTTEEERVKEKAQLDLDNRVLSVEIRTLAIRDTSLSSPIAGILTQAPTAATGVQLLSTDIFEIVDPGTLVFRAAVDEVDISDIRIGQSARIELDAYPDEAIESYITLIPPISSESTTGTVFVVEMPISATDLSTYRIGMNGDVSIVVDRVDQVLTVPLNATIERDNVWYVQVLDADNEPQERAIEVGLETADDVEVVSGLTTDDRVVLPE